MPSASSIKLFHERLSSWYQRVGRSNLPWRNTNDPYAVYISEVMLQQTQVQTVLSRYYTPFLHRFPTLKALADAPQSDVMKQWEGLGYYSRARHLHEAAKTTAPRLPDNFEGLITLPGIGKNTAHAILAFAYHQPVAVLEANVKRVVSRIFALKNPGPALLWQYAEELLNHVQPFEYNQAMMDLGAMVCLPRKPKCEICPAQAICQGKSTPESFPQPRAKKAIPVRTRQLVALRDANQRYYLTPRESRFLGGLYGFIELDETQTTLEFAGESLPITAMQQLGSISQTYSHFKLQAKTFLAEWPHAMNTADWHTIGEMRQLPLSKADLKLLAQLASDASAPQRKVAKRPTPHCRQSLK